MGDLTQHWRRSYDNKYLGAWDLFDKTKQRYVEVTAVIERITDEEVVGEGGRKSRPLQAHLAGRKGPIRVPFILSKKSCTTLQVMTGHAEPAGWVGVTITIYVRRERKVRAGTGDVLTIRSTKAGGDLKRELEEREEQRPPAIEEGEFDEVPEEPAREPGVD